MDLSKIPRSVSVVTLPVTNLRVLCSPLNLVERKNTFYPKSLDGRQRRERRMDVTHHNDRKRYKKGRLEGREERVRFPCTVRFINLIWEEVSGRKCDWVGVVGTWFWGTKLTETVRTSRTETRKYLQQGKGTLKRGKDRGRLRTEIHSLGISRRSWVEPVVKEEDLRTGLTV